MKAELVKIPHKGLCILISEIDVNPINAVNYRSASSSSVFSDIKVIEKELRRGKKIAAIKEIRTQTGWGLKEAKEYLDKFQPIFHEYNNDESWNKYADNFFTAHVVQDFFKDGEFQL